MKVFTREEIRLADEYTIANEPIESFQLMERAARQFTLYFLKHFNITGTVHVFCGKGNNGGDGLVISRLLLDKNHRVITYILDYTPDSSQDFQRNYAILKQITSSDIRHIVNEDFNFEFQKNDLIIDAMWGSGLTRPITGFPRKIIENINTSRLPVVAVDIPSGTYCDGYNSDSAKIKAAFTISFQLPKLAFFLPENADYVGMWRVVDIGLSSEFIERTESKYFYNTRSDISGILRPRNKFDHKGKFGHALLISGSYGKIGAAVLGAKACLRTGAGLVTAFLPQCGYQIMQTSVPEVMVMTGSGEKVISDIPDFSAFNCAAIGPGIGTADATADALNLFLRKFKAPVVIDADAINILSARQTWLYTLPKKSVLTPHPGEFDRLAGRSSNHLERLEKAIMIAQKHEIIIVLKGHYTAIVSDKGIVYFNSTGNPGMATAGSGDVLTGIILGLLTQGYNVLDSVRLGVYLHGLAGDLASEKKSQYALIAGDIIEALPDAFLNLLISDNVYEKK